jgi:hypothetical protein
MADRNPSFFGPVLPQAADAPDAFSFEELQRIRARRMEADLLRAGSSGWPEQRRFQTIYPVSPARADLPTARIEKVARAGRSVAS